MARQGADLNVPVMIISGMQVCETNAVAPEAYQEVIDLSSNQASSI